MSAELHLLGRFEVVTPPPDHPACHAQAVHAHGRFDEGEMLALGRLFAADVIIHTTVTQYSPYQHPRLGLTIQAVSPCEAKVVASVDGLWDTADPAVARQAREAYRAAGRRRLAGLAAAPAPEPDGHAEELALLSPALFQRFVAAEAARRLVCEP